jgi:integrase
MVTRAVRHLDGKGTLIDVTDAKTEAGERTLKLPSKLQPLLAKLAEGKSPDQMLFGERTRHWVLRSVKRCCAAAGVRVVSPHGLRRTHAKMAREVGVSGVLLAQAMGHESEPTTTEYDGARAAVKTQPLTASRAWCIKSGPPRIEQKRSVSKQLKSRLFSAMLVPTSSPDLN